MFLSSRASRLPFVLYPYEYYDWNDITSDLAVRDIKKNNKIQIPLYRKKFLAISLIAIIIAILLLGCITINGTTASKFISSTTILVILIAFFETVMRRINALDEMDYYGSKSLKQ